MNQTMRRTMVSTAVAVLVATGATTVRAETDSKMTGAPATPPAATAPTAGAATKQTSQPQHHESKAMPSPHRKEEAGTLKVTNKQARLFTLDCETCAAETKGHVYKAPPASNLNVLDGKRVRVTFETTTGKVQSIHRIDTHRHISATKKQA